MDTSNFKEVFTSDEVKQLRQRVAELERFHELDTKQIAYLLEERNLLTAERAAELSRDSDLCRSQHKEILRMQDREDALKLRVAELEKERDELQEANRIACEDIVERHDRIAGLAAERDKATQYWQIAEGRCDALMKQRDDLLAALEKLTDVFANIGITSGLYDDEQDALKEACDAIASVKDKA